MDASENAITQLRSLQPLANSLQRLYLADNRINSLGTLQSFTQLRQLDLSHNRIEVRPFWNWVQISHFPISSNSLHWMN